MNYTNIISFILLLVLSGCANDNNHLKTAENKLDEVVSVSDNGETPEPVAVSDQPKSIDARLNIPVISDSVVNSGCDVIVNAANKWLGAGGSLSGAIYSAAGRQNLYDEIKKAKGLSANPVLGRGPVLLKDGEIFTTGAYNLNARNTQYIIHALGPDFRLSPYRENLETGYEKLAETYRTVYAKMHELASADATIKSVGVVPISSGVFAGSANKRTLYEILVKESVSAVKTYKHIIPKIYVFGAEKTLKTIQELLEKELSTISQSDGAAGSVSLSARVMPASNGGYYKRSGLTAYHAENGSNIHNEISLTRPYKSSLTSLGVEYVLNHQAMQWAALKAACDINLFNVMGLNIALGGACQNISAVLNPNVHKFFVLNGCACKDFVKFNPFIDIAFYAASSCINSAKVNFKVGARVVGFKSMTYKPFVGLSLGSLQSSISALCSVDEIHLNVVLNN